MITFGMNIFVNSIDFLEKYFDNTQRKYNYKPHTMLMNISANTLYFNFLYIYENLNNLILVLAFQKIQEVTNKKGLFCNRIFL